MPQSKTQRTAINGTEGKPRKAAPGPAPDTLVEQLAKGVLLTAERIQEALDDAVRRGRITRDDAEEIVQSLVEAGRAQTEELVRDLESFLGRSLGAASDRLQREGDRFRRTTGLTAFPISRYDGLTASQITTRLTDLTAAQLRKVRDYERRHGNRKSVLGAIERRLGQTVQ